MELRFSGLVASARSTKSDGRHCMGFVAKLDMASVANFAAIGAALAFIGAIVAGLF